MSKNILGVNIPVFIIADSAFRFSNNLMKPYPFSAEATAKEKNFNYALSKCRRVVENAFGQVKARFRRIGKGIDNRIDNTSLIIKTCCVLHNFLNENNDQINEKWLQNQEHYVQERGLHQPEPIEDTFTDHNISAEVIRGALASHVSKY